MCLVETLLVETFAGRNFREFRVFWADRESLSPRNFWKQSSAIFLPKNDEKLHENKEIMVKNPLSEKVFTRESFYQ